MRTKKHYSQLSKTPKTLFSDLISRNYENMWPHMLEASMDALSLVSDFNLHNEIRCNSVNVAYMSHFVNSLASQ